MTKFKSENLFKKIKSRELNFEDFNAVTSLQLLCFPEMIPWKLEQFKNIIEIFPEGQICIEYNGDIIASSCSLLIDSSKYSESSSWHELTDNGYINNHQKDGDTLYGMEIMVHPDFRNMKLARRMYEIRKKRLCN